MRVLVTGKRGFVGSVTAYALALTDQRSIGFDIIDGRDIRDLGQLRTIASTEQVDRILHLAAIARFAESDADPLLAHSTNVIGTQNVVKVASEFHIPLVYASTGSVYMPINRTPPIAEDFPAVGNSVYGCTKYMGELLVRQCDAPWIILRYAHLYGIEKRGHGLVGGFIDRINRGLSPMLYGGQQSNDFTYIDDVAAANLKALEATPDAWRQVYNIGTGEELTAEEAGKIVCDAFGYDGPMTIVEGRTVDPSRFVFDTGKAERMLGFKAQYDFRSGMARMVGLASKVA